MIKMVKKVISKIHKTEYSICKDKKIGKYLCGKQLLKDGRVDKEIFEIQESPKSFKKEHRLVVKKLGITQKKDVDNIIKKIDYYE